MAWKGKRGIIGTDELVYWLIGAGILVLMVVLFMILKDKGQGILDALKGFLRIR